MDGNANPSTPGNNAEANDLQIAETSPARPYVQQFSANTAMILQRIKSGSGGLGLGMLGNGAPPPPGFEDMKKSVMQGMRTSHNMELPTPLSAQARRLANITPGQSYSNTYVTPYASKGPAGRGSSTPRATSNGDTGSGKGSTKRATRGRGTKRKRMKEESISAEEDSDNMPDLGGDSESDGSGDIVMPRMTQSGRQIVKPQAFVPSPVGTASRRRGPSKRSQDEKTEQALCKRCGRGHSPPNNQIVFCDGCNGGWHQMCHDPMITDEVTRAEDLDWFCTDCGAKRGIAPPFDPTKGVSWQGRSTDQKREYLQSLSQQQLVSLLLHSSNLHPNLPIFPPSPTQGRKTTSSKSTPTTHGHPQHAGKSLPPSATATPSGTLFSRSEANPNAPINFIRKIQSGSNTPINTPSPTASSSFTQNAQQQNSGNSNPTNKNLSNAQKPAQASSAPPSLPSNQNTGSSGAPLFGDEDADGSRESTPASPPYPKPGMGLMARLPPDDQDEEWLVDHGDYDVFTSWTPADGSH